MVASRWRSSMRSWAVRPWAFSRACSRRARSCSSGGARGGLQASAALQLKLPLVVLRPPSLSPAGGPTWTCCSTRAASWLVCSVACTCSASSRAVSESLRASFLFISLADCSHWLRNIVTSVEMGRALCSAPLQKRLGAHGAARGSPAGIAPDRLACSELSRLLLASASSSQRSASAASSLVLDSARRCAILSSAGAMHSKALAHGGGGTGGAPFLQPAGARNEPAATSRTCHQALAAPLPRRALVAQPLQPVGVPGRHAAANDREAGGAAAGAAALLGGLQLLARSAQLLLAGGQLRAKLRLGAAGGGRRLQRREPGLAASA